MDLSVIILNWNTKKLLHDCLESVFKQTEGIEFEVIVVDNASTDGSVEAIQKLKIKNQKLTIVKNKKNLGYAAGNNQGIKKAKGDWILLLNTDTKLKDNALKKLVDFAKTKPKLGVVGPRLLHSDGSAQPSAARFFTLPNVFLWLFTADRFLYSSPKLACQVDWVMGSALMVSLRAIKKAGPLDEKFFMYIEDSEWCYRIKKAGFAVWFYPQAEIYHFVRGSGPADWRGKQKAIWWIYESLVYFYQKHFAPSHLFVLKWLLRTKTAAAWLAGVITGNQYLKDTYAKAFKLVR